MRASALPSALLAAVVGVADAATPTFPNLSWKPNEVFTTVGRIDKAIGAPSGHSLLTVHRGMIFVIGSRDGGGGDGHLSVFDVADPRKPKLLCHLYDENTKRMREAHAIAKALVGGRELAAVLTRTGVQIWDWGDPAKPVWVSTLDLPGMKGGDYGGTPWFLAWQGRWLYAAGVDTGLHIVDVTDPAQPKPTKVLKGSDLGGVQPGVLYALGNLLVVTGNKAGDLATFDIGDPENPRLLARTKGPSPYSTLLYGNLVVFADTGDVPKSKGKPPEKGKGPEKGKPPEKAKPPEKPSAPEADDAGGDDPPPAPPQAGGPKLHAPLHLFDISDPTEIVNLGATMAVGGKGGYVTLQDGYLYAGMSSNYAVVDVSEPKAPKLVNAGVPTGADGKPVHGDFDFCSIFGNLVVSSSDHGEGSFLLPRSAEPDRAPPSVLRVVPKDGATAQAATTRIGVQLSDNIDLLSLTPKNVVLRARGGQPIPCRVSEQLGIVNISPDAPLPRGTTFEIELVAGGVRDIVGNGLAKRFVSTFSTAP